MTRLYCKACGREKDPAVERGYEWLPCRCGNRSWLTERPAVVLPLREAPVIVEAREPLTPYVLTRNDRVFLRTFCIDPEVRA